MAESGVSDTFDISNTDHYIDLCDYVKTCVFPQCVCVIGGSFLSRDVQISVGDVLLLKSCDTGNVILSYRDTNDSWTEVTVDLNYAQKFYVLPPKDAGQDNRVSMVMYPTISDLILDCPTYFEATSSYDDPYLPAMSVKVGDRFWFVQVVRNSKEGVDRLKVRDESGNILFLSLECRGNFSQLKDNNEYTVKELIDLAHVPRRLQVVSREHNTFGNFSKNTETAEDNKLTADEYTVVVKPLNNLSSSASSSLSSLSSFSHAGDSISNCLPSSFVGTVHLLKYEPAVTASPYNDLETIWTIPASANLKVRTFYQDDYEVPTQINKLFKDRVPLPISENNDVPQFRAPSIPHKPLVPLNIMTFADVYFSTLPVKAKILNTSDAPLFLQNKLKNVEDIVVYRVEEGRRLYVKDVNSDFVYGLSSDLRVSFVEYPEKFRTVSELLHLPVGTDVTVLEDIAADFPKPFVLRFGDVIRVTSNTPYFIKMKHATRDCQVIKCERLEPNGGDNTKLKLPMDFEVSMVMTVAANNRRMIPLKDLISGASPIPSQSVASVPENSGDDTLKDLPVDLRILRTIKETYVIIAPETGRTSPSISSSGSRSNLTDSGVALKEKKTEKGCSSSQEQSSLTNIGLPLTCGVVLAYRERLDLYDLNITESEADFIRIPVVKMSLAQFEERERLQKLNSEYEDVEFGSNSTIDESGSGGGSITRTSSTGVLDKKQKNTTMDKVLRFSRALNPKHWRHSKSEPEPLPHPSAMGLMALAARPRDDSLNEYHHTRMGSTSAQAEIESVDSSSQEGDENFYEDVEIGPLRASTIATTTSNQAAAFSGPSYRSLPPRTPPARTADFRSRGASGHNATASEITDERSAQANVSAEKHTYDVPKSLTKAKNLAANIGNNKGGMFSAKPQYDVPRNSLVKDEITTKLEQATAESKGPSKSSPSKGPPPQTKPSVPFPNKPEGSTDIKVLENAPIAPTRRKHRKVSSMVNEPISGDNKKEEKISSTPTFTKSISLNDSQLSSGLNSNAPKPKPRGQKSMGSTDESVSSNMQSQLPNSRSADIVKGVEILSVNAHDSLLTPQSPSPVSAKNRPNPPPKPKSSIQTQV